MAATTLDDALGNLALEMWSDNQVFSTLIEEDAFFGIIDKDFAAYGDPIVGGITHSGNGGAGSTLGAAQATYNSSGEDKWQIPLMDEHAVFQITNKARLSMKKSGNAAMVDGLEHETGKAMAKFKRNLALDWWRNVGGSRGVIASGSATQTITLTNPEDAVHIEIGDFLGSDDTDGTGASPADDGEYLRVSAVDPELGTVTQVTTASWDFNGNFVATDNLFQQGTIGLKPQGIPSWIPNSNPAVGVAYNGVIRSQNPVALAGLRLVADAPVDTTIVSALRRFCAITQRYGGRVTDIFLSSLNWDQCARELGNPITVIVNAKDAKGVKMAQIGYETVMLATVRGHVNLHSSVHLRNGRCYGINRKSWKAVGNRSPGLDQNDGKAMLRMSTAAALEGRFEAYINLMCRKPVDNFTGDITPVQVIV